MIALQTKVGWAVRIKRADGSEFFASSGRGVMTPTFPKNQHKAAVQWKNALIAEGFNARVVRVHYAHPVEIPKV